MKKQLNTSEKLILILTTLATILTIIDFDILTAAFVLVCIVECINIFFLKNNIVISVIASILMLVVVFMRDGIKQLILVLALVLLLTLIKYFINRRK